MSAVEIPWNDGGKYKDDFTARTHDGYILRAEKMGPNTWWWQVYYPDGSGADELCDIMVRTEYAAKRICALVYRLHSSSVTK